MDVEGGRSLCQLNCRSGKVGVFCFPGTEVADTCNAEEYYCGSRGVGSLSDFSGHLFGQVNFMVVPLIRHVYVLRCHIFFFLLMIFFFFGGNKMGPSLEITSLLDCNAGSYKNRKIPTLGENII